MPSRNNKHKREDWISIVVTIAFILGFLVLANSGSLITGFTTVEPVTTIDFEVNSVIPSTANLEIESGTQKVSINLSEFTIPLSDLQNIRPVYEQEKLVAYNISNITIDLANYNIQPTESITVRFMEIYKEITRESVTKKITKEEVITEEIVSVTKENITEPIIEENITEFETEEVNFTIQALRDDVAPTASDYSIPVGETTIITIQHYSGGASTDTVWATEDGNVINNDDTGSDFYCANGAADIDVASCGCGTCTANADCTVSIDCRNKDTGTITFTVTAAGNDVGPGDHYFRGGSTSGVWDLDSDPVTIELGADETPPIVNLQFPSNNTNSTSAYVNFTYNATDAQSEVDTCILWLEKSGVWELNFTDTSITETVNQSLNITIEDQSLLWRVECNDTLNNRGNSTTYNLTIDTTAPTVTLQAPVNNTNSSSAYVNFTYQTSDVGTVDDCSLWLYKLGSWELNYTDTSITETINQSINITIEDSSILWKIECNDTLNNRGNSTTYNITVDINDAPNVEIYFPTNNTNSLTHYINFTYNVTDTDFRNGNGIIVNCTLLMQQGESWTYNASNSSAITEGINQTINITLGHENINWTVECIDANGLKANATEGYFNYSVYDAKPTISLVWPANNTYQTSHTSVNLTYNITSKDSAITCDLYINDAWNKSDINIERNINQTFNLTFNDYQNINWSIGCNNSFNEYVNSTTYNYSMFEILNQPPTIPVENITQPGDQSINLDSNKVVSYTFVACDEEETKDSLVVHANFTGEGAFFDNNITCEATEWTNTTCKQFNCSMNIWYFYKAGSWNSSMNVTDGTYFTHSNISTFTLGETIGMVISPISISWSTLYSGQWNKTTDDDPIIINNTGNYNVATDKVNITGYDLKGEETLAEYIPGGNFSVGTATGDGNVECGGTATSTSVINATSTDITGSILSRGNHTAGGGVGQEQLYFCLVHVPPVELISQQSYSAENSDIWVLGVS